MKPETQDALKKFISRRAPELTVLALSWFGGEPLVAKDVVLNIAKHAHKKCQENSTALNGTMTTNAYLLNRDLLEELCSCDQRGYQVSLDGWGAVHDETRRLVGGKGTFDKIWSNISEWRRSDEVFAIGLRIHVRRDNLDSVRELISELAKLVGNDLRFNLDFQHIRDLGGEGGKTVTTGLSRQETRDIEGDLGAEFSRVREEAIHAKIASGEIVVKQRDDRGEVRSPDPYICYASKPNSLLVRADGRLGKCTVAFSDDRNTIGEIKPDGTVSIDQPKFQKWIRGFGSLEESVLSCPIQNMQ
jgi:uncharacterized protein